VICVVSIVGLLASCYYGISVMINRLNDFRSTVSTIRSRIDGERDNDLRAKRNENKKIGHLTHKYLDRQIVLFAISVLTIILIEGYHIIAL
jgi:hypothetical protein